MVGVEGDGPRVHPPQPLNGQGHQCVGIFQVSIGFLVQRPEAILQAGGLPGKVQVHLPPQHHALPVDQKVYEGRAIELPHVKGPLVALAEDVVQHLPGGRELLQQEFPLHPLAVHRDIPGEHLLVGPRQVPAEFGGGKAELPFGQIGELRSRLQSQGGGAGLGRGIDAVGVKPRRAAGGQDHIGAPDGHKGGLIGLPSVQAEDPGHPLPVSEEADRLKAVQNGDTLIHNRPFQHLGHPLGGVGADGGPPGTWVVVGLVAHVLPKRIGGEIHPQAAELEEGGHRARRLAESRGAVHAAPGKESLCHLSDAVPAVPRQGELVVGLLVASRVPGGARQPGLGDQGNVLYPQVVKPVGAVIARAARADDNGLEIVGFHLLLTVCGCGTRRLR